MVTKQSTDLQIVGINDLVPPDNLAYLLKYDSVHRTFMHSIEATETEIIVDNKKIPVFGEKDPAALPHAKLGVDLVIECTGRFSSLEAASGHLKAGAKKVIISAPAQGDLPTIVMGVNHSVYDAQKHHVVSNASCTTNCLAPLAKVLLDNFGFEEGIMTTVHSLTATQPTVDGPSKKDWRGGRAASVNIIPSSTGAAKAVGLCLPQLKGKLTGMAFRIPTIDVSAVDLTVRLGRDTTYEEICEVMRREALTSMRGILTSTNEEVVSTDFIGSPYSCIFDEKAGIALNPRFYKLIAWYDNEWGYSNRVVDLAEMMASFDF